MMHVCVCFGSVDDHVIFTSLWFLAHCVTYACSIHLSQECCLHTLSVVRVAFICHKSAVCTLCHLCV